MSLKFRLTSLALFFTVLLSGCGLDGNDGEIGETGAQGPQGETGTSGSDGQDATTGISMKVVARAALGSTGSAEILQFHADTQTIYATNSATNTIAVIAAEDIVSVEMSDPINTINLSVDTLDVPRTRDDGGELGGITSIAVSGDLLAVAITALEQTDNGYVYFYTGLNSQSPSLSGSVEVGALPDSIAFTPDGTKLIIANEGEPNGDYSIDPEGSLAVIDILASGGPDESAQIISFTQFNEQMDVLQSQGMHFPNPDGRTINGNQISISVAQDLEPEYVSTTNEFAYVTLQENNGLAVLDLSELSVQIMGLGVKNWADFNIDGQENTSVSFAKYEGLFGVYMPDTIANFIWKDATFLVTANEGDSRAYFFDTSSETECTAAGGQAFDADDGCLAFSEEVKLGDLVAEEGSSLESLQTDGSLNDLRVTNELGDQDNDGEFDAAYAYGARSFTIWDQNGLVVYDSGDDFERITASVHGSAFNNNDDENEGDSRSENKGPEPEALTVGTIGNRTYAFVGLERMGGIFAYDITNPYDAFFADYAINRNLTEGLTNGDVIGDLAPESLVFVPTENSPTGNALLLVGNEVSGTVTVWEITPN